MVLLMWFNQFSCSTFDALRLVYCNFWFYAFASVSAQKVQSEISFILSASMLSFHLLMYFLFSSLHLRHQFLKTNTVGMYRMANSSSVKVGNEKDYNKTDINARG